MRLGRTGYLLALVGAGMAFWATGCGHKAGEPSTAASGRSAYRGDRTSHGAPSEGSAHGAPSGAVAKSASPSAAGARAESAPESAPAMKRKAETADMDEEWHEEPPRPMQQMPPSGLLTAGLWDDNLNFDTFINYRRSVAADQMPGLLPVALSVHERTAGEHQHGPKQTIDISFVIDATGSMGDEIAYLQSEFDSLSREIEATYANSRQRWSLVVYRDEGDEYVVRGFDFEDSPRAFRKNLLRQSAGGGGDYPEAAHQGLREAVSERWRSDPRNARLLFWVADAPHHDEQAHAMSSAIHAAYRQDIHIYPVASSGVDELTELTMRSAAQLTGGRYIFLTDDSGVGLSHKEPTIPCYHVTSLRDTIMRSVAMEMEGEYLSPHPNEIVRTSGTPDRGRCRNVHPHDQVADGWHAGGSHRDTW